MINNGKYDLNCGFGGSAERRNGRRLVTKSVVVETLLVARAIHRAEAGDRWRR
jgi:hypothetical protein